MGRYVPQSSGGGTDPIGAARYFGAGGRIIEVDGSKWLRSGHFDTNLAEYPELVELGMLFESAMPVRTAVAGLIPSHTRFLHVTDSGVVVAGGTSGGSAAALGTSNNAGASFTDRTPALASASMISVLTAASSGGTILIAGTNNASNKNRVYTTTNLTAYTQRDTGVQVDWNASVVADGKFWLFGQGGNVRVSGDLTGAAWSGRVSGTTDELRCALVSAGRVIAAGQGGRIITCDNGVDFTSRNGVSSSPAINLIIKHGAALVAGGNAGTLFVSHDNGDTWTLVQTRTADNLIAGVSVGGGIILFSTSSRIYVSRDLSDFTQRTPANDFATAAAAVVSAGKVLSTGGNDSWFLSSAPAVGIVEPAPIGASASMYLRVK